MLSSLSGSVWFSTLDMLKGYWQVELDQESMPKTGFTTHLGLHQWKVMPFGLSGAQSTFQKLMQIVLRSMTYNQLLAYLHGVILLSISASQDVERLSEVFDDLSGKISVLRESLEGNPEVTEDSEGRLWDVPEMKAAQVEDSSAGPVYKFVEGSEPCLSWEQISHFSRESKTLLTGWDQLWTEDGCCISI